MQDLDKFKNEMNLSGQNVYVGHRYVPKIMGDWDNTQLYEPLSIVQYQGNSFTSRQYVPSGIELTNEDYWASTGNYNAQVEQYRQDVRNLENDVNNVIDEVINARDGEANLGEKLAQKAEVSNHSITPDIIGGENDYDKLNNAVAYILSKGGGTIRLERMYNITEYPPIFLNKNSSNDRKPVTFLGDGGGILKNDEGFMFDSETRNSGDWYFNNVIFQSINGRGTTIFNGHNLIRIKWINCHSRYVDHILSSESYTQSTSFIDGSIVGGSGWAFQAEGYYDFTMSSGLLVEHREHFFKQEFEDISPNTHRALYNVRFRDIVVEGLTGKTFDVQRVESLVIDGVYLELNKGGYIDFTKADYLDGVSISNVRVYNSTDFVVENDIKAVIEWGGEILGAFTNNIYSRNLPVHDTTQATYALRFKIYSNQDLALDASRTLIENVDPDNFVIEQKNTQNYALTNNDGRYNPYTYQGINSNNLDDFIKSGVFNIRNADFLNTPVVNDLFSILEVKDMGSDIILQELLERPSSRTHVRIKNGATWGSWVIKESYPLIRNNGTYSPGSILGTGGSNADDFIKSGVFQVDSNNVSNTPTTDDRWGFLTVKATSESIIMQEYVARPSGERFTRFKENSVWGNWV